MVDAAVRRLRFAFWVGAIVDAAAAVQMLSPRLFAYMMGLGEFRPGAAYVYAMGLGAALMFGWTALLLRADPAPMERRDELALTVFPVIVGLALNEVFAVRSGFLSVASVRRSGSCSWSSPGSSSPAGDGRNQAARDAAPPVR